MSDAEQTADRRSTGRTVETITDLVVAERRSMEDYVKACRTGSPTIIADANKAHRVAYYELYDFVKLIMCSPYADAKSAK